MPALLTVANRQTPAAGRPRRRQPRFVTLASLLAIATGVLLLPLLGWVLRR